MHFVWGHKKTDDGAKVVDLKAATAELVAMTIFVIVGCGTACAHGASDGATRLLVAFSFGMAIMVLAYAVGPHSGGQINCAVTLSLVLGGKLDWWQGLANLNAQLIGSVLGAMTLCVIFPCDEDMTTTLGTNIVAADYSVLNALMAEVFGTFLLCYVVYETAVSAHSSASHNACVAIGFAVFLAHLVLLPIDGCSINPSRSFGPAIVSKVRACSNYTEGGLENLGVMWVGPLLGAALAALVQRSFVPTAEEAEALASKSGKEGLEDFSSVMPGYDTSDITLTFEDFERKFDAPPAGAEPPAEPAAKGNRCGWISSLCSSGF